MPEASLYGWHAVRAALARHPERLERIWLDIKHQGARPQQLLDAARARGIPVERVPGARLDALAAGARHQGVAAVLRAGAPVVSEDLPAFLAGLEATPFLLVLDGVQDPHNLGACLRSAAAAGAQAVIVPKDNAAPLTAAARKAASGAAEVLPLLAVTNLARALDQLKEAGVWLVGADGNAEQAVYTLDLTVPLALVLGGEGRGLRRLTRERCDFLARIPMAGSVESLNVSVAAGICLFEVVRQRAPNSK
ncbi:MAG TPA: 23S rRNA (guanosine(2251)-2'-O)-methyltransferase RlmB [Acidiferrobacterales bacterium]